MRLLVLSRMFPSEMNPSSAIFMANFLLKLSPFLDDLLVISPRVYVPKLLAWRRRWARYREISRRGQWQGIEVVRPAFLYLPFDPFLPFAGTVMERCVMSTVKKTLEKRQ